MMPKMTAIDREAICSHLPCPKGCSLSAFFDDSLVAMTTMTELSESDKVCQASAANAIEPVIADTHILAENKIRFIKIDTVPAKYPPFVLFICLQTTSQQKRF